MDRLTAARVDYYVKEARAIGNFYAHHFGDWETEVAPPREDCYEVYEILLEFFKFKSVDGIIDNILDYANLSPFRFHSSHWGSEPQVGYGLTIQSKSLMYNDGLPRSVVCFLPIEDDANGVYVHGRTGLPLYVWVGNEHWRLAKKDKILFLPKGGESGWMPWTRADNERTSDGVGWGQRGTLVYVRKKLQENSIIEIEWGETLGASGKCYYRGLIRGIKYKNPRKRKRFPAISDTGAS